MSLSKEEEVKFVPLKKKKFQFVHGEAKVFPYFHRR